VPNHPLPAPPAAHLSVRRRVLAVGPGEGFLTGQSAAFLTYVRKSRHAIHVVNTNDEGKSLASRAVSSIRVIIRSAGQILFHRPECVYISTSRSKLGAIKDISVIALARLRGVPVVNHLHGITFAAFRESIGALYGFIVDWAYGNIAASIVLHENLIAQYARYPRMKVLVVNNFVDADVANSLKSKSNVAGPINILFMSNMIPEKGVFELIDAVKNLLAEGPGDVCLKIAGRFLAGAGLSAKDVEAKLFRSIAGSLAIEYCGFADPKTKRHLLEWAHVLALPSYMKEEAIPLVILEGMAAGCYLIVSDFGVLPQLVKELVAAVVPARDVGALQKSLAAVRANPGLLSEANTRNPRIAREKYPESRYISGIDAIIREFACAS
jgi:glycosyltransferase involved in cell wall biosynthesis